MQKKEEKKEKPFLNCHIDIIFLHTITFLMLPCNPGHPWQTPLPCGKSCSKVVRQTSWGVLWTSSPFTHSRQHRKTTSTTWLYSFRSTETETCHTGVKSRYYIPLSVTYWVQCALILSWAVPGITFKTVDFIFLLQCTILTAAVHVSGCFLSDILHHWNTIYQLSGNSRSLILSKWDVVGFKVKKKLKKSLTNLWLVPTF